MANYYRCPKCRCVTAWTAVFRCSDFKCNKEFCAECAVHIYYAPDEPRFRRLGDEEVRRLRASGVEDLPWVFGCPVCRRHGPYEEGQIGE